MEERGCLPSHTTYPKPSNSCSSRRPDEGGTRTARSAASAELPQELCHSSLSLCNHSPRTRTNPTKKCIDLSNALDAYGIGGGRRWTIPWPSWSLPRGSSAWRCCCSGGSGGGGVAEESRKWEKSAAGSIYGGRGSEP